MLTLPFEHLNLTRNPFGEMEPDERAQVAQVDTERLLEHLKNPRAAIQLEGACGRGKSTHLHAIRFATAIGTYLYCEEDARNVLPELEGPVVMIDEVQRLSWLDRRRLFRSCFPIVIATHVDYSGALTKADRNVLCVGVESLVTTDRLVKAFNSRIEYVRRSEGRIPMVTHATTQKLIKKHGTNIREMESDLYEVFQSLSDPCDV